MPPKAQEALGEIDLLPGEQVVYGVQGDGFFLGTNPAAKVAAQFMSWVTTLTGGHLRIFLILTTHRVLMIQSMAQMCGCTKLKNITAIALASVMEAGSDKETQGCCFHARQIRLQSLTQSYNIIVKNMDDNSVRNFVSTLSAVIVQNAVRR